MKVNSTALTLKEITRLHGENQTIQEELCELRRENELSQRELYVISSVVDRIGNIGKGAMAPLKY